jgi:hypothetical protein
MINKTILLGSAPFIASCAWFGTILALLILWLANGRPRYKLATAKITYISNVGAHYKALFIAGTSVTAFFFIITLVEFLLFHRYIYRNNQKLTTNSTINNSTPIRRIPKSRTWADILAFWLGLISVSCLVLLAIFDSIHHERAHWVFTLIFAFGAILCSIFNLIAVSIFRHMNRGKTISFFLKILFIIAASTILVAMIILTSTCSTTNIKGLLTEKCDNIKSIAAILEWILAGLYFIFICTWIIDFTN